MSGLHDPARHLRSRDPRNHGWDKWRGPFPPPPGDDPCGVCGSPRDEHRTRFEGWTPS